MLNRIICGIFLGAGVMLTALPTAEAVIIVVNHDEWTLSNTGFAQATADPGTFATNIASLMAGGFGTFHAYSTNFGLTQSSLATAMTGAGHAWTTGTGITFDLPTLLGYDGIFLGGNAADNDILIDYVEAGGNVYLMGGTGAGGATAEAARWNTFLNHFGLNYVGGSYNGVSGTLATSSVHPIFAGVDHLYYDNGNTVTDLDAGDPRNQILEFSSQGIGLIGIYDSRLGNGTGPVIPEPSTMLLLGLGGLGAGLSRRRRGSPRT